MKHTTNTNFWLLFCALFSLSSLSFAQEQPTSFKAELQYSSNKQAKNKVANENIYSSFSGYFKQFEAYDLPAGKIHDVVNSVLETGKASEINLNLGDKYNWDLTLNKFAVLAPNYLHSEGENGELSKRQSGDYFTYKGYANGNTENRVVLCVKEGYVNGFVMIDGVKHNIQSSKNFDKNTPSNDVVVFTPANAIEKEGAICNHGDGTREDIIDNLRENDRVRRRAAGTCIELAVAYDPGFDTKFGGNGEDEIIARVALLSDWYTNDFDLDIEFKLVETHLERNEEISPVGKTAVCVGGDDLVSDIGQWGNTGFVNEHDIGAYWVARDICGSSCGVVGCATISGVCRNNRYNVNEDFFRTTQRNTIIWAHEIGHNLGAQHSNGDNLMSASLSGQEGANFGIAASTRNSISNSRDNATCLSDPCNDTPPVPGFSSSSDFCSLITSFEDRSSGAPTSRTWDFNGDGVTDATSENPTFTFTSAGTYPVKMTVTNQFGTNEITQNVIVEGPKLNKPVVTVPENVVCVPDVVNMQASGTGPFNWYSVKDGGTLVNTGASYAPTLTEAQNFFVTSGSVSQIKGGSTAPSSQGGFFSANDVRGLVFNVNQASVLRSVVVEAETAGSRTIELLSRVEGDVLASKVVSLAAGLQRISLDFDLPTGTGYFLKVTGETVGLFRDNEGINYPINIGNAVTLTGTNAGSEGFYYFFYDWILDVGCVSEPTLAVPLVDVCQSVNEEQSSSQLSVFPSPSNGSFVLKLISNSSNSAEIVIRNSVGQTVFVDKSSTSLGYEKAVDLSSQPKGVYVISVEEGNNVITEKLVIK